MRPKTSLRRGDARVHQRAQVRGQGVLPCWPLRAPALLSAGRGPVRSCSISLSLGTENTAMGTVPGGIQSRSLPNQRETRHSVQSAAPKSPTQLHDGQLLMVLTTLASLSGQMTTYRVPRNNLNIISVLLQTGFCLGEIL